MADAKKSLYNVALANQGYLLTNIARKRPRTMNQSSVFGTRFAQGDRSYLDFNLWWYWAQSEWSNGLKDTLSWADDGKYYFSSNIDTFNKVGSLQLQPGLTAYYTSGISNQIYCGVQSPSAIGNYNYFLAQQYSSSPLGIFIHAYNNSTQVWDNIGPSDFGTIGNAPTQVNQMISRNGILWIFGSRINNVEYIDLLFSYNGTTITDQTVYIAGAGMASFTQATCGLSFGANLYVAMADGNSSYIYSASETLPSAYADWTKVFTFSEPNNSGLGASIIDMAGFNNQVYYLVNNNGVAELWSFTPGSSPFDNQLITSIKATNLPINGVGGKMLIPYANKLFITVPDNEIWSIDTSANVTLEYLQDPYKKTLGLESTAGLVYGGVVANRQIYWGNLICNVTTDGSIHFSNWIKDSNDVSTNMYYPMFVDNNNVIYGFNSANLNAIYKTSGYKGTPDKNFLVFSQNDVIPTIDKIFHHATFNFNYLATGESIIIEYLLSDLTPTSNASWTSLDSASFATDGSTINTKTIYFPDNAVGKKMWLRVKLESSSGTTTPTFNDIAIAYLPMPDLKHDWTLYLECYDNMMLLDGKTKETKRGEELKSLLKFNWWSKTAMDFQDVDYAETLLNGAITDPTATTITVDTTLDFSQQGRLRIEQEEILYTGKSATTFTGCTRGARGSLATTHADNTLVATNYKVIIQSLEEFTPELQNIKVKNEESVVVLSLREL